jgi:Flp pilus assembly protein TadG
MMNKQAHPVSSMPAQRGVAAVEFAIILPLLVLIFTGLVEYGRLMWHYDALAKATRDAARHLSTVPAASLASEVSSATSTTRNIVASAATAAGIKDLAPASDVNIACSPNCASATAVTVSISYGFTIGGWVPVIGQGTGINNVTMSPHTTMPYMR